MGALASPREEQGGNHDSVHDVLQPLSNIMNEPCSMIEKLINVVMWIRSTEGSKTVKADCSQISVRWELGSGLSPSI